MLEKDVQSSETLRHICDCFNRKYVMSKPAIYLHDIHAYFLNSNNEQIDISFCPYCGVQIDSEGRP